METELKYHLVAVKDIYCGATKSAPSTVAQSACGDWRFFDRIDSGASFTARTYDRAMQWFSDKWPESLPWPDDVERPAKTERAA